MRRQIPFYCRKMSQTDIVIVVVRDGQTFIPECNGWVHERVHRVEG